MDQNRLRLPLDMLREPNPLLQTPTLADAWSHNVNAATDWMERERQVSRDRGLWTGGSVFEGGHPTRAGALDAVGQYANALLMGTTAPTPLRAFHGSGEVFEAFSPTKVGSGAIAESKKFAKTAEHADEYYLTTNPTHADRYGPNILEFEINKPLFRKDAKAELEQWAKDQGYPSAQKHLDDYYEGDIYAALDLDSYLKAALEEARAGGFPGVHVSLGDLKSKTYSTSQPIGDFIVLHDPSVATRVKR